MEEDYIMEKDYITKYLKEMEVFAKSNNVPIVRKQTLSVILDLVKEKVEEKEKNKREIRILELGTAIAYSSINMINIDNNIIIDTVEKSKKIYDLAKNNIEKIDICESNVKNRINMYLGDAFKLLQENTEDETGKKVDICNNKYDIVFIDANKSKYLDYFNICKNLLNDNGIIILDNVLFAGYVLRRL
ncbi:MAG: class I SAM-dependent methyltransferase [Clostridiales bacterium]|nr:class I SAM-dependent methyltransferase [Clostridiales bacterium]